MDRPTILITKKLASPPAFLAYGNEPPDPSSAIHFIEKAFIRIAPVYDRATMEKIRKALDPESATAVIFTSKNAVENTAAYFGDPRHQDIAVQDPRNATIQDDSYKDAAHRASGQEGAIDDPLRPWPEKMPAAAFSNWRIFCLDGITRNLAASCFGADRIIGSAKYASALAQCIIDNGQFKKALFFCGDKRRETIPGLLTAQGIAVEEIVVYHTQLTPVNIQEPFDGIAFFSPSAVESFFSLNSLPEKAVCFAIGKTTAASIGDFTANPIIISGDTAEQKMIATIKNYFDQH
ncbi:MAG: uroporphyrinogen-III synthase [Chitinophagaceae bacterium]|nr:uroporphyrinogen-III synthase [Chitinophagaceae bacterium]